jgi:tripartite-type tricarboxylate transporter receptor subunit TctC
MLNTAMGSRITHIPYRGSGPAMQNLIGGRVDFLCDSLTTAVPQIQNGAVKPIAILSSRRSPVLPNLATAEEQGLTGIDVDSWNALFLPKGAPVEIIRHLSKAVSETLDTPSVRQRLESLGQRIVTPDRRGLEYLAKLLPEEIDRWAAPIRASGTTMD